MDKRDMEEKFKDLQLPPQNEARKKVILRTALGEFESAVKENALESKGIDAKGRQKDRKPKKSIFKGGSLMTRQAYMTISIAFAAVLLIFGFYMSPGLYKLKSTDTTFSTGRANHASNAKELSTSIVQRQTKNDTKKIDPGKIRSTTVRDKGNVNEVANSAAILAPALKKEAYRTEKFAKIKQKASAPVGAAVQMEAEQNAGYAFAPAMPMVDVRSNIVSNEYSGRDNFERLEVNPVKLTRDEPVSTFSLDVDTASYAFVRRALNQGHLPQKDAVRIEELINYFDYDYKLPESRTKPFEPTVAVYPTPWNKGTKLMHIGIKGHDIVSSERPRANLVFLLDVSGSMSSADKLPLLKNSMKMLVGELRPEDTVAIAVYAGAAGTVLEPTKVSEKGKILAALERLQAGGSTAGGAGIKLAYALAQSNFDKKAVNRVILATDGDFNVGIRDKEELKGFVERKRETGVFLSVLGFGQGNYNDALMQKLAQNGNGNAAYIDTLSEARKVLVEESSSTLFTIAKDVKIQVEFNPERVAEYRLIGYESRMLNREDFSNDKVDAGDVGSGHSVTAIYEITPKGSASTLVDPLRYREEKEQVTVDRGAEYAFLKIRYKLPKENKSRLITMPIDKSLEYADITKVPTDLRFGASVAAFGQILKQSKFTGEFGFSDLRKLAENSRGFDKFGYRSEFLSLIGLAESASTMGDR